MASRTRKEMEVRPLVIIGDEEMDVLRVGKLPGSNRAPVLVVVQPVGWEDLSESKEEENGQNN
jgi:hypothetical protein